MSIESFANQHVLELVAYQPGKPIEETARELGLNPHDIVKLASNENPLGPSPKAVEAIARAAAGVNIYPDGAAFRLLFMTDRPNMKEHSPGILQCPIRSKTFPLKSETAFRDGR